MVEVYIDSSRLDDLIVANSGSLMFEASTGTLATRLIRKYKTSYLVHINLYLLGKIGPKFSAKILRIYLGRR